MKVEVLAKHPPNPTAAAHRTTRAYLKVKEIRSDGTNFEAHHEII
jgi:hypothetical protein